MNRIAKEVGCGVSAVQRIYKVDDEKAVARQTAPLR